MYGKLEDLVSEWHRRKRALFDGVLMGDAVDVYRDGMQLVQRIGDELEMLQDQIGPSTSHVSPAPVGHTGKHGDPVSDTVERIDDLECLLSDLERENGSVRRQIIEGISSDIVRIVPLKNSLLSLHYNKKGRFSLVNQRIHLPAARRKPCHTGKIVKKAPFSFVSTPGDAAGVAVLVFHADGRLWICG